MDPLSPWLYARRNARKTLPTIIILTFVVMLVVVILATLAGLKESTLVYAREFDHWTVLFPKKDTRIPAVVRDALAARPDVERVIDSRNCFVRIRTLLGPLPYHLRAVKGDEMAFLLGRCGARLKEGALPRPGTSEVALHENLMRANGWSVGAEFGMEVTEDDWMPGRFRVVGILEGPTPLGLASFEYLNNPLTYAFSAKLWERVIVVPRPGRAAAVNAHLRELKEVRAWDKARAVEEVSQGFDRIILIFNFISALLIIVVAVVVGLLNSIFFAQRTAEFAILLAIGHTRQRLSRKVALETAWIMGLSWAAGVALAFAVLAVFRAAVLEPRGIPLPLGQAMPVLVSLAMPGVAQIFASGAVIGRLRRLDPVTLIERRG